MKREVKIRRGWEREVRRGKIFSKNFMKQRSSNGNNPKPEIDVTMHWLLGSTISSYLQTCHLVSVFEFWKHLKSVLTFHYSHPFFWVIESWKQSLKTPPNKCSFRGSHSVWMMDHENWVISLSFHPSKKALNYHYLKY